jgi:pimeloyl-ACP methyl ester carboxylesterase
MAGHRSRQYAAAAPGPDVQDAMDSMAKVGVSMAKASMTSRIPAGQPRVRRGYFECRYGQLHVHNAIPPGGGFEEGTSLLCLHRAPQSGRVFERFLALAGQDRSVYAPDIPGFGESDGPTTRPSVADYAGAVGDFLDSMRFRQIDILGYQLGALIAAELAIARPQQVRRVVLVSVPAFSDADREIFRQAQGAGAADGNQLVCEWQRARDSYGPGVAPEVVANALAEKLRSGTQGAWATTATLQYPMRERLGQLTQPALVLRPKDVLWEATQRVRELLPKARLMDLPDQGQGLFEVASEAAVDAIKDFLRG